MPYLPQIRPVCKKMDSLLLYQGIYRGVNLDSKTDICQVFPQMGKWAKAIEDEFLNSFALFSKFGQSSNFPHFC